MARVRILAALTAGLLTVLPAAFAVGGTPEAAESSSVPALDPVLSRARQFLSSGQTALAARTVHDALLSGVDDALLCLSGEIAFRRAAFDEAAAAFENALRRNPENARAHWGLGRIDQLHFRTGAARDRFSRAYSLDPRDTDLILSFAEFVDDPAARAILLRNVAALSRPADPVRAEQAIAQLKVLERLQGRAPARLASPYAAYRLPLSGFHPSGAGPAGLTLAVRINDGKPLRLLLDTGARGISIDAHAAAGLHLETLAASRVSGFGDTAAANARLALARTVAIGSLVFDECPIDVTAGALAPAIDGVIGIDLFEAFLIRLDAAVRTLELTPFDGPPSGIPALGLRKLLLLHTALPGGPAGLFLLDTGAAFTSVARDLVPASAMASRPVDLFGAQGLMSGALRLSPLQLSVAGRPMVDPTPVALDLRAISQSEGLEISGILGYSLLSQSPLTIDFRSGTVSFSRAR